MKPDAPIALLCIALSSVALLMARLRLRAAADRRPWLIWPSRIAMGLAGAVPAMILLGLINMSFVRFFASAANPALAMLMAILLFALWRIDRRSSEGRAA